MIPLPYTRADPGTMVVVYGYATVTKPAVEHSRSLYDVTGPTFLALNRASFIRSISLLQINDLVLSLLQLDRVDLIQVATFIQNVSYFILAYKVLLICLLLMDHIEVDLRHELELGVLLSRYYTGFSYCCQ